MHLFVIKLRLMKLHTCLLSAIIVFSTFGCIKGESYCELPPRVTDAFEFGSFGEPITHAPSDEVLLYISKEVEDGTTNDGILYSFSTPHYFINPKGDYTEDIVRNEEYRYVLKDTGIYADTIPIEIYSFNDCGRSEVFKTFILYE